MAYADLASLRIAAGGTSALAEISDSEDAGTLAAAQLEADAWIDGVTRRINSAAIPWDTTDAPQIKALAAAEVVYILRMQKRIAVERDDSAHARRKETLEGIAAGKIMPSSADTYPVGAPGTPLVVDRGVAATTTSTTNEPCASDWSTEGFL